MTMRSLTVWLLSDGKPGHVNQTMGIVRALELRYPCHTHHLQVRWPIGLFRRLFQEAWCRGHRQIPEWLIRAGCNLGTLPRSRPPDVIISTGGNTLWANAWLASRLRCSNIFCGKLRQMPPESFTAALTIQPSHHPNVVELDIAPNLISPERADESGRELKAEHPDTPLWCLLVGGDGAGYRYDLPDWSILTEHLNRMASTYGVRWLIVTSRRTARDAEKLIRGRLHSDAIADAVWYHSGDNRRFVLKCLGASDRVFVTEDSMTMIHESIASGRPVHALRPNDAAPDAPFAAFLAKAERRRWLKRLTIEGAFAELDQDDADSWAVLAEDPGKALLRKLSEKLSFVT
jgi:uncharacterized protein